MSHAAPSARQIGAGVAVLGLLKIISSRICDWFQTPKRPYGEGSVGSAYDEWAREGVLEHYWGEHIHMGSYNPMDKQSGYRKKDSFFVALIRATLGRLKNFKEAKIDFVHDMIDFSRATAPKKILDVGCGIGGSSRRFWRSVFQTQRCWVSPFRPSRRREPPTWQRKQA
ncbi:unnamed protein product [Effrenium voratum]|nr:unnamed protein product [Effrenium voratum]